MNRLSDAEIIARIRWSVGIAPRARGGPKWTIAANIPRASRREKPIGVALNFKYAARRAYIAAATRRLQRDVVARYRRYNEAPAGPVDPLVESLKAEARFT